MMQHELPQPLRRCQPVPVLRQRMCAGDEAPRGQHLRRDDVDKRIADAERQQAALRHIDQLSIGQRARFA